MTRYVIIRILQALIALIGIIILVFILVRLSGDPMDLIRTPTSTEEEIARLKEYFGLDKSYPEQLWIYLSSLFRGDFGTSIIKRQPVIDMIKAALPYDKDGAVIYYCHVFSPGT